MMPWTHWGHLTSTNNDKLVCFCFCFIKYRRVDQLLGSYDRLSEANYNGKGYMHDLSDLSTCKNRLIWNLDISELPPFKSPEPRVKHVLKFLVKVGATHKIVSALQCSSDALGIALSFDFFL